MLSFVLFENTVNDMEGSLPDHDVVMKQVVGEDVDGSGGQEDVGPDHDTEHGQAGVVVEPVEAVLPLHQVTEAVHQLVVKLKIVLVQFVNPVSVLHYLSFSWGAGAQF